MKPENRYIGLFCGCKNPEADDFGNCKECHEYVMHTPPSELLPSFNISEPKETAYPEALKYIIGIRDDREGNWEQDWRHYTPMIRGGITELKTGRITTQVKKMIRGEKYNQEALIDSLADLANYTLFWLQIELEKKRKEKK